MHAVVCFAFWGFRGQSPGLKLFCNRRACEVPKGLTAVALANKANKEYPQTHKEQRQHPKAKAASYDCLLYPRGHPLIQGMSPRRHPCDHLAPCRSNLHPVTSV